MWGNPQRPFPARIVLRWLQSVVIILQMQKPEKDHGGKESEIDFKNYTEHKRWLRRREYQGFVIMRRSIGGSGMRRRRPERRWWWWWSCFEEKCRLGEEENPEKIWEAWGREEEGGRRGGRGGEEGRRRGREGGRTGKKAVRGISGFPNKCSAKEEKFFGPLPKWNICFCSFFRTVNYYKQIQSSFWTQMTIYCPPMVEMCPR